METSKRKIYEKKDLTGGKKKKKKEKEITGDKAREVKTNVF